MPDATIVTAKRSPVSPDDADVTITALRALAWLVGDAERCSRFFGLTGLSPTDLRERAGEPALQAAVLTFLAGNEADLLACADALDLSPETLGLAARSLAA